MSIEKLLPIHILPNGVKCYELEEIMEADMEEAQSILDQGEQSGKIDADSAYVERIGNSFVGTYQIMVKNEIEYNRFKKLLTDTHSMEYIPTFEEWRDNKVEINGRKMRLAKWLRKEYVCDSIIDFYSAQPRTHEKLTYLTISDMPQHIAGMTYNTSGWHSCQHPRNAESIHLGGALYDSTLLVAMLHDEMSDLYEMKGKLLARSVMRIMDIDGIRHLTPSTYYGSVESIATIHECLTHLEALRIHSKDVRYKTSNNDLADLFECQMEANGSYDITLFGNEWVYLEVNESVEVDCPTCDGTGNYKVFFTVFDKDITINCPLCGGGGKYEMEINVSYEDEVEAEEETVLLPYTDDYEHTGNYTYMNLSRNYLSKHWEKYPK